MAKHFGTDGIRGIVNKNLTHELAFRCGNALGRSTEKPKIIIGGDTRNSRNYIISSFSSGAMNAGADIIDIGICTTPGISYITSQTDANYGVVVSASHNPPEFNGIKIFDSNGIKFDEKKEENLEKKFNKISNQNYSRIGKYYHNEKLVHKYEQFLASCCKLSLSPLTIVIDGSNGAGYKIAPKVFKELGAKVIKINCNDNGNEINNKCGSTHPETLSSAIIKYKANVGFAFDGDADRIIACDENGKIVDGDIILFVLAKYLKKTNSLNNLAIVATTITNKGIEEALNNENIKLIRTDVGDKYVIEKMNELKLNLGGEKSGHIILKDYISTGDGILTAIKICEIMISEKKKLSTLSKVRLYPQHNINVTIKNKEKIIKNNLLIAKINNIKNELKDKGRIIVRASGTEPKIRIMIESKMKEQAEKYANELKDIIIKIDKNKF